MNRRKTEAQYIYTVHSFGAITRTVELAIITFNFFFTTVYITRNTKATIEIVLSARTTAVQMIRHHARIIYGPLGVLAVTFDGILNRTRYLLFLFLHQHQLVNHDRLLVRQ